MLLAVLLAVDCLPRRWRHREKVMYNKPLSDHTVGSSSALEAIVRVPIDQPQDSAISFGPFRLLPKARLLEKDGVPVRIGGRAFDILIVLAQRPGEVVDKRELVERVWANVNVDEGSLRFHVSALRKALGDTGAGSRYVVNVQGRGYCFAASTAPGVSLRDSASIEGESVRHFLPSQLARMVGRT